MQGESSVTSVTKPLGCRFSPVVLSSGTPHWYKLTGIRVKTHTQKKNNKVHGKVPF